MAASLGEDTCEMRKAELRILQEPAYSSLEERAFLNLLRTGDVLERAFHRKTRDFGLTATQYNALRILRKVYPNGLTCAAIGNRMITAEPDITRLLGRLKTLELIQQTRDGQDRRVVWTRIAPKGLELLERMTPTIERVPVELLGHMSREELTKFVRLLEKACGPGKSCKSPC